MSDHYHYDYAYAGHDHDTDHQHFGTESTVRGLREDLGQAEERIRELQNELDDVLTRLVHLEARPAVTS